MKLADGHPARTAKHGKFGRPLDDPTVPLTGRPPAATVNSVVSAMLIMYLRCESPLGHHRYTNGVSSRRRPASPAQAASRRTAPQGRRSLTPNRRGSGQPAANAPPAIYGRRRRWRTDHAAEGPARLSERTTCGASTGRRDASLGRAGAARRHRPGHDRIQRPGAGAESSQCPGRGAAGTCDRPFGPAAVLRQAGMSRLPDAMSVKLDIMSSSPYCFGCGQGISRRTA
jgi:hypothetical protein